MRLDKMTAMAEGESYGTKILSRLLTRINVSVKCKDDRRLFSNLPKWFCEHFVSFISFIFVIDMYDFFSSRAVILNLGKFELYWKNNEYYLFFAKLFWYIMYFENCLSIGII